MLEPELIALLAGMDSPDTEVLRLALRHRSSQVAFSAALAVRRLKVDSLGDALVCRFVDLMETQPVRRDPGCRTKEALLQAMVGVDHVDGATYAQGVGFRQPEPVWGGQVETAGAVRALCLQGLIISRHPQVIDFAADRLVDESPYVRAQAATLIGDQEGDEAYALLRLKVRSGDVPIVTAACAVSLLAIDADRSFELVYSLLQTADERLTEAMVIALGESRLMAAFDILLLWWMSLGPNADARAVGLTAMAIHRSEQSHSFLFELIANGSESDARRAIDALGVFRDDSRITSAVEQAAMRSQSDLGALVRSLRDLPDTAG